MTGWATIEVAVSTMQNGANDFIQKPWDIDRLIAIINNQIKLANSEKTSQKLSQQNQLLQQQVDSEFKKVGGNKTQSVDIRLISATNADLNQAVDNNAFRKDLLYRINTIAIEIPPLRARKEDIILLAQSFLSKMAQKHHTRKLIINKTAQQALLAYDWPGNIRELNHVMERAHILCQTNEISVDDLGLPSSQKAPNTTHSFEEDPNNLATLETLELNIIDKRLSLFDGNVIKAAKSLGLSRSAFYRRLEKM